MYLLLSANERGSPNVNPFSKRKRARGYLSGKVSFEYFGRPVSEPTPCETAEVEILGAEIEGVEGCPAAPLLIIVYIDGAGVSFACLRRRLTVAPEMLWVLAISVKL